MIEETQGANGRLNCISGVCCGAMEPRIASLAAHMCEHDGMKMDDAMCASRSVLRDFDIAPKGTVAPLVKVIARLAREGYTKADA